VVELVLFPLVFTLFFHVRLIDIYGAYTHSSNSGTTKNAKPCATAVERKSQSFGEGK
jgi:hypothetical protein